MLVNVVHVTSTMHDSIAGNNSASVTTTVLPLTQIPGLSAWGLVAMGLLLTRLVVFGARNRVFRRDQGLTA